MKSVLISIRPQWVEKIASGQKTIEVRKTAPQEVPFKCYIYCTFPKKPAYTLWLNRGTENKFLADGKVIGEFICDKVFLLHPYTYDSGSADLEHRKFIQTFEGGSKENEIFAATCLTQDEMFDYIGAGNYGFGWHISDLKIYDKPKELSEFYKPCSQSKNLDCDWLRNHNVCSCSEKKLITRAPQSWQYIEDLGEEE